MDDFYSDYDTRVTKKQRSSQQPAPTKDAGGIIGFLQSAGRNIGKTYNHLGTSLANAVSEFTGQEDQARKQTFDTNQRDVATIRRLGKQMKTAKTDEERNRIRQAISRSADTTNEQNLVKRQDQIIEQNDPLKGGADVASVGLDILGAGAGTSILKGGLRQAISRSAKQGALFGGAQGALEPVKEKGGNVTAEDIGGGAAVGAGAGALAGGATGGVLKGTQKVLTNRSKIASVITGEPMKEPGTGVLSGVSSRVADAAKRVDANVSGVGTGKSLNGRTITPERSQELLDFARTRGVTTGSPRQQSEAAQGLFNDTTQALDSHLQTINRPLETTERKTLVDGITSSMEATKGVGAKLNTDTQKFIRDIKGGEDVVALEKLRREADDLGYKNTGAGKTIAAKQAQVIRDKIDEFVSNLSMDGAAEYKAVKSDYRNAKDLLELSSKNANNGKHGLLIPLFNTRVGSQVVPGAVSKGSGVLARANRNAIENTVNEAGPPGLGDALTNTAEDVAGAITTPTVARGAAELQNQQLDVPPVDQGDALFADADPVGADADLTTASDEASGQYSPENVEANVQAILAQGGSQKDVAAYLSNAKAISDIRSAGQPKAGKGLNSTASGVIADTKTGLKTLQELIGDIKKSGANAPFIGDARALNPFDTEAQNLQAGIATARQIVGKALEGGVLRKEDEEKYKKILPTVGDTDAVATYKVQALVNLISNRLNEYQNSLSGGSGGADLATLGI